MTGAAGAPIGIRLLQELSALGVETHLVLSRWARAMIEMETDWSVPQVRALADHVYGSADQVAAISSGSFPVDGMIVAPWSMRTLAAIRCGYGDDLITRAADVTPPRPRRAKTVGNAQRTPATAWSSCPHQGALIRLEPIRWMPAPYDHALRKQGCVKRRGNSMFGGEWPAPLLLPTRLVVRDSAL